MPCEYVIDRVERTVLSRARGALTIQDLDQHTQRLSADALFQSSFRELFDVREVTAFSFSTKDVRALENHAFDEGVRRAVLVSDPTTIALARTFNAYCEARRQPIGIFRDLSEAFNWLDERQPATAWRSPFSISRRRK
jgi:hypothetical protein